MYSNAIPAKFKVENMKTKIERRQLRYPLRNPRLLREDHFEHDFTFNDTVRKSSWIFNQLIRGFYE